MKRIYGILSAAVLLTAMTACSLDGPVVDGDASVKAPELTEGVVEGELLVRFSPQVAAVLDKAGLTRSVPATRSGILSVDEILDLVEGYEIERVFPVDRRNEERSRKNGLHLWYVVRFDASHPVQEVAQKLSALGEVSQVEYNCSLKRSVSGNAVPLTREKLDALRPAPRAAEHFNDLLLDKQWDMVNEGNLHPSKFVKGADVNVGKAWELTTGNPSIIVAVLDEGVDVSHEDLAGSLWVNEGETWRGRKDVDGNGYAGDVHGYNFVENTGVISVDSKYDSGHGTHVAGVIAARNNNGKGISSIAGGDGTPDSGVRIMSCQIFSGNRVGTVLDEVRAIKYAADNGAVVLQCSWGYVSGTANPFEWVPEFTTDEQWKKHSALEVNALDYFVHNAGSADGVIDGGIAVFAAGNESAPSAGYPGAYPDFVSVAATAPDFTPATYTNYGKGTTICAPGGDQDYFYDYGEGLDRGTIGCILSTLPEHISETGYGYMEGTSMACPHVSGVVALGLSYAAQLRKHFKAEDVIRILHDNTTPVDGFMEGIKKTYKFTVELVDNHCETNDLSKYQGKMGHGQVNAYEFLKAIEGDGAGLEMSFPNILVDENGKTTVYPALYFEKGSSLSYVVKVDDGEIATCKYVAGNDFKGGKLIFEGVHAGQTRATISATDGQKYGFVITVRKSSDTTGWL